MAQDKDEHIGIELMLPVLGELKKGKVISRKRSPTGHLLELQIQSQFLIQEFMRSNSIMAHSLIP